MSQILEVSPHPKYYLSPRACRGILRRARERGKELPEKLEQALMLQSGLIPPRDWDRRRETIAFAANQRDEVRDLHDVAGALGAQPGMKQQTFIAGFSAGAGSSAGSVGYGEELAPTLKGSASGNCMPSVLCLNDQGGQYMSVSSDRAGTLRAQMDGHPPLVLSKKAPQAIETGLAYTGNMLQSSFHNTEVTGSQMANQGRCYNTIILSQVYGQQSYAHYTEGVSTLAATGGIVGGGGENLVVAPQPLLFENHGIDARVSGSHPVAPTMSARYGTGGNNIPLVAQREELAICIMGNAIDRQPQNGGNGIGYQEDIAYTLTSCDRHSVWSPYQDVVGTLCRGDEKGPGSQYVSQDKCILESQNQIRRLTPLECERLQGFPDGWTDIPGASDSARYKALGNSVAIPCVEYILRGVALALRAAG